MTSTDSIPMERFSYHSLHLSTGLPLLEATQQLVLDQLTGYSMVIDWQAEMIRSATTFTREELAVVFALASDWPSYVPYEALMTNEAGERLITPSQIDDARATRYLEKLIAPLTTLIETCCTKLQALDLDISEVDQYGYRLTRKGKIGR